MLIDRNDELAVLHEKAHMQEAQTAAGNLELGLRDNEVGWFRGSVVVQVASSVLSVRLAFTSETTPACKPTAVAPKCAIAAMSYQGWWELPAGVGDSWYDSHRGAAAFTHLGPCLM